MDGTPLNRLQLIQFERQDVLTPSQGYAAFLSYVSASERHYPRIGHWLETKVAPEIGTTRRQAFLGLIDGIPVLSAVIKTGSDAKLCHLRVAPEYRQRDIGSYFFATVISRLANSRSIHFTLPESVWRETAAFFRGVGFDCPRESAHRYRSDEVELECRTSVRTILSAVTAKLIPMWDRVVGGEVPLLMSVKPGYAEGIIAGRKTIELRRRFSESYIGRTVYVYATHPVRRVIGQALIANVTKMCAREAARTRVSVGATEEAIRAYMQERSEVYAIQFAFPRRLSHDSGLTVLGDRTARQLLRPPQSYCQIRPESVWWKALGLRRDSPRLPLPAI